MTQAKRVIGRFALTGTLVCAGLTHARAQDSILTEPPPRPAGSTQSIDDIRTDYRVHVGPFYVNPTVMLKELGVDTNVFNQAGDQKSDFTFTVTPQAEVAAPIARRALFLTTVALDSVYYATYNSERSLDPQVVARGEIYARRLTLFAEDSYINTRQRPNYEIDLRSRHLENDANAGVIVRVTPRASLEFAVQNGRTRFDGDAYFLGQSLKQTLDRDTRGYSATMRHKLTPLTTIVARGDYREDRFPFSPVRNNNSYRILPGVEFKPRALISGSAYVGYREVHSNSGALPGYRGVVGQVGLSYTLLGSTMFGATAYRDVRYSFEVNTPYYLDNSVGGFVQRELGPRFDVVVNAARHQYQYRELVVAATPAGLRRADTTDAYGANIGYHLRHQTRVGFGFSNWTRASTVPTYPGARGLRIGTTVTYGF